MGYRSEVVFAVDKELAPFFTAMLAQNPAAERLAQAADCFKSGYEEEGDFIVSWEGIKWYEGYEDVDAFIKFIEALSLEEEDEFPGVNTIENRWRFVRVGEDYTDIVDMGGGFWDISLQRSISY